MNYGEYAYNLASELFPICRSLTGNGVRETLNIIKRELPELVIKEIPSGTQVFDWTVPKEWNIKDAWIKDHTGKKIVDFSKNNLHVVGYSTPIHTKMTTKELIDYLFTEPNQPTAIPYVTSYYTERWGFCISENQRNEILQEYDLNDEFEVMIDSALVDGSLTYGELIIYPHSSETDSNNNSFLNQEIFLSTYVCHPSLANNELSGPCLAVALAKWLKSYEKRRYTYRIIFIPENIGSIAYLSENYSAMKKNVIAGFNLTCVGDDRTYSYVESAYGNTLADKVLKNVLHFSFPEYKKYSFLISGSDERRYNAPGIDLPVVCFSRTLYGKYPEYHTSLDNLSIISPSGLGGSFNIISECIYTLERNIKYKIKCLCEPQLGKRGLYPTLSRKGQYDEVFKLVNMISYLNGKNDLLDISNIINVPVRELCENIEKLLNADLIEVIL